MKIALLADYLDFGYQGVGIYVYNLASKLLEIDNENEYVIVHNERSRCREDNKDIFSKAREITIRPPLGFANKYMFELLFTKRKYPKVLIEESFDIVHESNIFGTILPKKYKFKVIITVHDLSLYTPDFLRKTTKAIVLSNIKKILNSNMEFHFISVSNNTREEMIRYAKVPAHKISVVHNGVDHRIFKPMGVENAIISDPFILYVGSSAPRKNLPMLFRAFCKLKKRKIPHKLVIVSSLSRDHIKLIRNLNVQKEVIIKPYVATNTLVKLYNTADLFVLPSLYEGFGLTVLEAMACGCPVATSNIASLPEIVSDAGKMFDPLNVDSIANVIVGILADDTLKKELKKKCLKRAGTFDWKTAAKKTLDVYRKIYEGE